VLISSMSPCERSVPIPSIAVMSFLFPCRNLPGSFLIPCLTHSILTARRHILRLQVKPTESTAPLLPYDARQARLASQRLAPGASAAVGRRLETEHADVRASQLFVPVWCSHRAVLGGRWVRAHRDGKTMREVACWCRSGDVSVLQRCCNCEIDTHGWFSAS